MNEGASQVFTVMLEPSKACNLKCRYCYSDTGSHTIMSREVVHQALEKAVHYAEKHGFKEIHLIWHGGEPLLTGIEFYRHVVALLSGLTSGPSCRNFIQTNGLLLDNEFCTFFRDVNFEVGLSLDGPAHLHDFFRMDKHGGDTHSAVLEKVCLLEEHQVPVGFNAVVTRRSLGHEGEIYRFFQDLGYGFRVNPVIPAREGSGSWLLEAGEHGGFLRRLFDEWTATDSRRVNVSPLDMYLRAVLDGETRECQQQPSCMGTHLGIKASGEAMLCSRFQDHLLGDIREVSVDDVFQLPLCEQVRTRADGLKECHSCVNWLLCHGGCPHNSIAFGHSISEKDPFCKDYQMIFAHIRNRLRQLGDLHTGRKEK